MNGRSSIPAWKRLGLKLKYANENPERAHTNGTSTSNTEPQTATDFSQHFESTVSEPPKKKRKTERKTHLSDDSTQPPSTDTNGVTSHHPEQAVKKQVSFSADTKSAASTAKLDAARVDFESEAPQRSSTKPKKISTKNSRQATGKKSNAALNYLNQYQQARSGWKFNKNREIWILKHVFSKDDIPESHNLGLAMYIHGLQGTGARERLKTQCVELLSKSREIENKSNGNIENPPQREDYVRRLLDDLDKPPTSKAPAPENDEEDHDYGAWIQQQSRPTLVLRALGLNERLLLNNMESGSNGRAEHVNGSATAVKGKKRKNRTAIVDYDSSSSDSSSSSSSSDDDSDANDGDGTMSNGQVTREEETSSSGGDEESSSSDSDSSSASENS